jgi:hypothetical protein
MFLITIGVGMLWLIVVIQLFHAAYECWRDGEIMGVMQISMMLAVLVLIGIGCVSASLRML